MQLAHQRKHVGANSRHMYQNSNKLVQRVQKKVLKHFDLSFCKLLFFFMNGKRYTLSGQRTADEYSLPIDSGNTPALIIQRKTSAS